MGQAASPARREGDESARRQVAADKALFGLGVDGGSLHRTEDGYLAVPPHSATGRGGNVHMVVGNGEGNTSRSIAFVVRKPPPGGGAARIERSVHDVDPKHYDQLKQEVAQDMGTTWKRAEDRAALGGRAPGAAPEPVPA